MSAGAPDHGAEDRWSLVPLGDVPPTPWRNGAGRTRELLAWPAQGDWRIRMSVAEVSSNGAFSHFEGVQRWFAVLSGAGVRLRLGARAYELTPSSEPFAFDGFVDTTCELLGSATHDFNLMTRNLEARMQRVRGTWHGVGAATTLVAVYAVSARAVVDLANERQVVPAHTLAWRWLALDAAMRITAGDALWLEVRP